MNDWRLSFFLNHQLELYGEIWADDGQSLALNFYIVTNS